MSSAFLYLAIVAIWAFVLVPRWVRRSHLLGHENAEPEDVAEFDDADQEPRPVTHKRRARVQHDHRHDQAVASSEPASAPLALGKVLQARRRLLLFLIALAAAAGACAYLKLAAWWVCVPPALILGVYFLLLRSAALADAEQARRRAARELRVQAARQRVDEEAEYEDYVDYVDQAPTAEVIDISGRLGDQVYDQYADAAIRAVGD
jgi:hypothetical protein